MINWAKTIIQYDETGNAGACPNCHKGNIAVEEQKTKYGRVSVYRCDKCGIAQMFSRREKKLTE